VRSTPRADLRERQASGADAGPMPTAARVALVLVFCVVCVEWSVGFWGATFADAQVGLSTDAAVTLSSAFFAAMLAGRLAGSALSRRIAADRLVAVGLSLALAGFPVLWLAEDALTAGAGLVIGFGVAALFPLSAAITFAAAPRAEHARERPRGDRRLGRVPDGAVDPRSARGRRRPSACLRRRSRFLLMGAGALAVVIRRPRPLPASG
jgi:Major Facilitator Superfamily